MVDMLCEENGSKASGEIEGDPFVWVLLHELVARQRASPNSACDACDAWDAWDAWDVEKDFAALVVALPMHLLQRVLSFAQSSQSSQSFEKEKRKAFKALPSSESRPESSTGSTSSHFCCKHIFSQGSCLHGRVLGRRLACWYCTQTFSFDALQEPMT